MKKNALKFLVDSLLFVDLTATAAIGLILRWAFPAGASFRAEKFFLVLHRHQWREFHFVTALLLILLIALHLSFNPTWIVQSTKKYFGARWKIFLLALCFGWAAVLMVGYVLLLMRQ